MATPSRFNRPYGTSASGQASWEKINRPDRQLGDQSLANQPATASGRGYYDPARILERVARGRPGTTMQQAQGAIAAEGYKEYDKLRSQMGQQQQAQTPQGANMMPPPTPQAVDATKQFAGAFQNEQTLNPRGGLGGYLDVMAKGWTALGASATADPRTKKVLEAKGAGTFDTQQANFNASNPNAWMNAFGNIFPLDTKGDVPYDDIQGFEWTGKQGALNSSRDWRSLYQRK